MSTQEVEKHLFRWCGDRFLIEILIETVEWIIKLDFS